MGLILVVVLVIFIVLTVALLTVFLYYYNMAVSCDISPNVICYTDWLCPTDADGNATNDGNGKPIPGDKLHCHLKGMYGTLTEAETATGAACEGFVNRNLRNCVPYIYETDGDGKVVLDSDGNPTQLTDEQFYDRLKGCKDNKVNTENETGSPFGCSCLNALVDDRSYEDKTNGNTYDFSTVGCSDFYTQLQLDPDKFQYGTCTKAAGST